MWAEPLTAETVVLDAYSCAVVAYAGDGLPVARVLCAYNVPAGTGVFGEMSVVDQGGGPRQRIRALVLLVREALRFGAEIGIVSAHTDAPPRLAAFAARMSGLPGEPFGPYVRFGAALHVMRSAALNATDPRGEFVQAAPPVDGS